MMLKAISIAGVLAITAPQSTRTALACTSHLVRILLALRNYLVDVVGQIAQP